MQPLGNATSVLRKRVLSLSANTAPSDRNSGLDQSSILAPGLVPSGVHSSWRYRLGPMGSLRSGSRDSEPCSLMCSAVIPSITMVSCLVETMKMPARRWQLRTPPIIFKARAGLAALDT